MTATAFSNQRKLDRTSNGVLWSLQAHVGPYGSLFYSTDGGVTWAWPGSGAGQGGQIDGFTNGSMFIDADDYLHVVWKQSGTGGGRTDQHLYYMRGTPDASRTSWTFSAAVGLNGADSGIAGYNYPDLIVHREGTGWVAHIVASFNVATTNYALYQRVTVDSAGTATRINSAVGGAADLAGSNDWGIIGGDYAVNVPTFPSIDFNHTGDGKTVAGGTPHLYVGWSAGKTGAGFGIRFRKAVYAAGSWTWNAEREIDPNLNVDTAARWVNCLFDGTRVIIPGFSFNGSAVQRFLYERDAADTTTTSNFVTTLAAGVGSERVHFGAATYDASGNVYFVGSNNTISDGLAFQKWTRATSVMTTRVVTESAADAPYVSVKRGYGGSRAEWIYTHGNNSPYSVKYDFIGLNVAPLAPTLTAPANNAVFDRATTQRFDWDFHDPDGGDSQSKYDLRYRLTTDTAWTTVTGTTPNTFHDFLAGTFAAGDYEWQVRTYDAQGVVGPYSASGFFTAANAPTAPTITAPISGGTVNTDPYLVTWSYPTQAAYQVRTLGDDAGTPNLFVLYTDTGVVESTSVRSRSVAFPEQDRYEHVQVRVRDTNGLWSPYASHRVLVSYTRPAVPWARVTPDNRSASIAVDVVNSTAWGYGGSGAAKNAASAALIDLAALGVARVLWLPGAAGNYVSTPDRNMLPAHADSFEDGTTGGWINYVGAAASVTTARAVHGTYTLRGTPDGVATTPRLRPPSLVVTAGTVYTMSASIYVPTGYVAHLGGKFASGTSETGDAGSATGAGGAFVRLSLTVTVPTGSDRLFPTVGIQKVGGGAVETTVTFDVDAVQVEEAGSASPFTPSLRVTGDLDLRAHVALEDWTPGAAASVMRKVNGYYLAVLTSGALFLEWFDSAGNYLSATSTASVAFTDGAAGHIRVALDVDNSASGRTVRFYTSTDGTAWTQLGSDVVQAGVTSIRTTADILDVGRHGSLKGKVLSASVRAGIDGPEVAAYDATAHTDATFTDSTGKAWTVSRSGDATAEIVDRTTWAFTGSEYLTLPDREAFGGIAGGGLTLALGVQTRSTSNANWLVATGADNGSGTSPGIALRLFPDLRVMVEGAGGRTIQAVAGTVNNGAWHIGAGEWNGSAATTRAILDGTSGAALAYPHGVPDSAEAFIVGGYPTSATAGIATSRGLISWVALFRRTLTADEHTALAAWDGSINTEPEFLRTGAALYVNAADSNQRTQYAARNLVLNLARTADEGGVASDLPVVTENRVWRSEWLPSGEWSPPMRVKIGLSPDGVWVDRTPASGREYRYEVESFGENGTTTRSGFVT